MEIFFKILYFFGMIVEVILRAPYYRQHRKIEKTDRRVTASERVLLVFLSLGTFVLPLIYVLTPWFSFADYALPTIFGLNFGAIGLVFLLMAIWLFWRAHYDLGANYSPSLEITASQELVTQGVFGIVRHPMYTSLLLWGIAQVLMLQNWITGPASLVVFLLAYFFRVPREEQMMLDHFGESYRYYCTQTGRILPLIGTRRTLHG